MMETRTVEVGVCRSWRSGDTGEWYTSHVEIPVTDDPDDIVEKMAIDKAWEIFGENQEDIVHIWIYWLPQLDDEINHLWDDEPEELED